MAWPYVHGFHVQPVSPMNGLYPRRCPAIYAAFCIYVCAFWAMLYWPHFNFKNVLEHGALQSFHIFAFVYRQNSWLNNGQGSGKRLANSQRYSSHFVLSVQLYRQPDCLGLLVLIITVYTEGRHSRQTIFKNGVKRINMWAIHMRMVIIFPFCAMVRNICLFVCLGTRGGSERRGCAGPAGCRGTSSRGD